MPFQVGSADEAAARGAREMIALEDPDGIRTEVHHGPGLGLHAFHSDKIASGFKTSGMGMGHVLINVRDCARTEQFYRDVLGFCLSDYIDTKFMGKPLHAVFLHVNRRHHSLASALARNREPRLSANCGRHGHAGDTRLWRKNDGVRFAKSRRFRNRKGPGSIIRSIILKTSWHRSASPRRRAAGAEVR